MSIARSEAETSVAEDVFKLLKRRGALCASQLSAELLVSLKSVNEALEELETLGLIAHRRDRDDDLDHAADEIPWGIRRPFTKSYP
jgi:Mn-dependent DtxR family transcriptional regulator